MRSSMHFGVEFYREEPIDELFVHRVCYRLVAEGARYNAAKYPGKYLIIGSDPDQDVTNREEEVNEETHKLANIVAEYGTFNLQETSLTLHLNYIGEVEFSFDIAIVPKDDGSTLVKIQTHTDEVTTDVALLGFLALCKNVFECSAFEYGQYTNENYQSLPFDREKFLEGPAQVVTFYSDDLAAELGREKLLSAPAETIEELDNGIFLLACIDKFGSCKEVEELREYLGQERYQ